MAPVPNDVVLRERLPQDSDQLTALWHRVFGDPPELAGDFLRLLPEMGNACVAERSGRILGAAYLVHGFTLQRPDAPSLRCGYLYAVAVEESARGLGLGTALSRGAAALGKQRGAELICTLPAEDSLYRWYGEILCLRCRSTRTAYTCRELPAAEPLSAADYLAARESLLRARPHVALSEAAGLFQQKLCEAYGGGMFRFDGGLFCAYRDGDRWMIPELLPDDAALAVPDGFSPATKPYLCSDLPFPEGCLWNLTFD